MGLRSDEEVAITLAAAVENYAAGGAATRHLPWAIEEGLDNLLYQHGGDGLLELSVAESGPTCITIVGIVIWVTEQTLSPFEARLRLDKAGGAVKAVTIRAGHERISRRDAPKFPQSWRVLLRIVATRPTADEDWAHVLHYEFD